MQPITPAELRQFCADKAFKIGEAFPDSTLESGINTAILRSSRVTFKGKKAKRTWIMAFAAMELCESSSEGRDRNGYASRARHSSTFEEIMRRHSC